MNKKQTILSTIPLWIFSAIWLLAVTACGDENVAPKETPTGEEEIIDDDAPDQYNIKGSVTCDGAGIADVVVSDGVEVTKTNAKGNYYLQSNKKHGYVFISVPGNYEIKSTQKNVKFFLPVSDKSKVEEKNFILRSVNNEKHVVLALADFHLAKKRNDILQLENQCLPDINATIADYKENGAKVYALSLGDLSWDAYWYETNYALQDYLLEMNKIDGSMFNCMGNHDNDMYQAGDFAGESVYKAIVGPTYYSFNLGKVHYIVLDNMEYINTGASQGTAGSRTFNSKIIDEQLGWLKKDLATITDKTAPIIVAMHVHCFKEQTSFGSDLKPPAASAFYNMSNGNTLLACFAGFSQVHIVTGHTHLNYTVEPTTLPHIMEHNTAAVCATWWWTGYFTPGKHLCKDGTPGGYGIWELNGKDVKWYYKSVGYDKNYQFRTCDLNQVLITKDKYLPNTSQVTAAYLAKFTQGYETANNKNEVLINVWNWDTKWSIEVKENGATLPVTRVMKSDPLHIIIYEIARLRDGSDHVLEEGSSALTDPTSHIFKVTASNATSALNITVTDRFGNKYTETMTRPKNFDINMW